uniref:C2H2-type zinc finger n=2 Tax=Schistocephalus solidus TaxID=70667 RepID=A0A0X3P2Y1_SCHSO
MLFALSLLFFLRLTFGDLEGCSREKSRLARRILSKIFSETNLENLDLPDACPLKPSMDYFSIQDDMLIKNHEYNWECGFCGKRFYDAHFLEKHFDNRHNETLLLVGTVNPPAYF